MRIEGEAAEVAHAQGIELGYRILLTGIVADCGIQDPHGGKAIGDNVTDVDQQAVAGCAAKQQHAHERAAVRGDGF